MTTTKEFEEKCDTFDVYPPLIRGGIPSGQGGVQKEGRRGRQGGGGVGKERYDLKRRDWVGGG